MGMRGVFTCVLLCSLAVLDFNRAKEIEDDVLRQLLKTPTVIPTRGGYYIFVPSKNSSDLQIEGPQNPNQLPGSNQSPANVAPPTNAGGENSNDFQTLNIDKISEASEENRAGNQESENGEVADEETDDSNGESDSSNEETNSSNEETNSSNEETNSSNEDNETDVTPLIPRMVGVNRPGAESSCTKGTGVFNGPTDQASIDAMKKWNIQVVRIPLNQDCWLGVNEFSWGNDVGDNYRKAVTEYVDLLRKNDIKVILDLHWSDGSYQGIECSDFSAKCQKPMPDTFHSVEFWKSVASQFKNDDSIIFDLFSSPSPDQGIQDKDAAWKCWRNGGNDCASGSYWNVVGMQDLVNAVRETGAENQLMIGGLRSANDLSQWEQYVPNDPKNKIIASWHSYKESECNTKECWEKEIAPLAEKYPVIVGEIGEKGCTRDYIDKLMSWLDKRQIGYLAWGWSDSDCSTGPSLISDYNGTPTEFGKGLLDKLSNGKSPVQPKPASNSPASSTVPNPSNSPAPSNPTQNQAQNSNTSKPATESKPTDKTSSETSSSSPLKKRLRGVNRSSFEYSCVQNLGLSEGPMDDNAIKTMKSWNINVVRVPLNQDCWLGINGHNANYIGANYQKAVEEYVKRLRSHDLNVIVDLHWTNGIYGGPGQGNCYENAAKCQKPMPDRGNSPKFWKSVADKFKNDEGIIFDIFNEPFPDMVINDKTAAWKCLRDGGSACPGFQYEVAGMQELVDAVRSTGAKNLVMTPGLTWTNDLSRWLEFKPNDSANNIAASWHSYDFNACNNQNCWDSQIAPVAAKYPVIVGEIGEHGCSHSYVDKLMPWLDQKNINYVAWTWNTWDCSSGPALISDYNGSPTNFGVGIRDHFKKS